MLVRVERVCLVLPTRLDALGIVRLKTFRLIARDLRSQPTPAATSFTQQASAKDARVKPRVLLLR